MEEPPDLLALIRLASPAACRLAVGHADISPSKPLFVPRFKVVNDQPINIGITVRKNSRHNFSPHSLSHDVIAVVAHCDDSRTNYACGCSSMRASSTFSRKPRSRDIRRATLSTL